jgi:hypothetical protein
MHCTVYSTLSRTAGVVNLSAVEHAHTVQIRRVVKRQAVEEQHSARVSWLVKLSAVEAANAEKGQVNLASEAASC